MELGDRYKLLSGDCLRVLKTIDNNSIDSLVTDPPAGISFMGKDWDHDKGGRNNWINWMTEVMQECLRVMRPGAHGLVWAIPRTSHWTAMALEYAGFEVRDSILHCFGQGFPKSLDISKAIDKAAGAKGEIIEQRKPGVVNGMSKSRVEQGARPTVTVSDGAIRAPATAAAKQWQGFGTALKPAVEIWWLIRKPISEKTVAANVLKHGVGGINIDASRVATEDNLNGGTYSGTDNRAGARTSWGAGVGGGVIKNGIGKEFIQPSGRFPANLVLSHADTCTDEACDMFECPVSLLDEQSGERKSAGKYLDVENAKEGGNGIFAGGRPTNAYAGESGGASRFFYCAKASKSDKGKDNSHPTVKSTKLMQYLIRMVTPPNGLVLDPFTGSGSTGVAAIREGFRFIGIEREPSYLAIAEKRIEVSI